MAILHTGFRINDWYDGQVLGSQQLFEQGAALDPKRIAGRFAVPVFVLQGAGDCSSPTGLARSYVRSIAAPRKAFVVIPNAGHFTVFMRSDEFLEELLERVRPLALETRKDWRCRTSRATAAFARCSLCTLPGTRHRDSV